MEFCYDSHPIWITRIAFGIVIKGRHAAFDKYVLVRMSETVISVESTQLSWVKLSCYSLASGNCHIPNGWWRLIESTSPFLHWCQLETWKDQWVNPSLFLCVWVVLLKGSQTFSVKGNSIPGIFFFFCQKDLLNKHDHF